MVGSHEGEDNRLTGRVARAPRPRPTELLPTVETGAVDEAEMPPGDSPVDDVPVAAPPVAAAEPEIETVTKLMGFLRSSDD